MKTKKCAGRKTWKLARQVRSGKMSDKHLLKREKPFDVKWKIFQNIFPFQKKTLFLLVIHCCIISDFVNKRASHTNRNFKYFFLDINGWPNKLHVYIHKGFSSLNVGRFEEYLMKIKNTQKWKIVAKRHK